MGGRGGAGEGENKERKQEFEEDEEEEREESPKEEHLASKDRGRIGGRAENQMKNNRRK